MNSNDLTDFSQWTDWTGDTIASAPNAPGVYAFRIAGGNLLRRLQGESDLIYIGGTRRGRKRAGTIQRRLENHLRIRSDEKDAGFRLARVQKEVGPLQVARKAVDSHVTSWFSEGELLNRYVKDHIELPPLNRQETGRELQWALQTLKGSLTPSERERMRDWLNQTKERLGQGGASAPPKSSQRPQGL